MQQFAKFQASKSEKIFHPVFIPLIPLESAGEYVECRNCKGTFIPRVLEQGVKNDQFMALYETAMRHSMIKMMLADGVIDDNEKSIVLNIIHRFGNNDINEMQLESLIGKVQADTKSVAHYLRQIAGSLNEQGKETIIKCALHVALSDGDFDNSEKEMILEMGQALEMSSSHLKGIFAEMMEQEAVGQA